MDQGTPWGLIIVSGQFNVLPLISMTAEVHIFDIAASISLVQEYKNNTSDAVEVCYLFPIPDRSVVNSFCLVKEDGRKIVGEIEERVSGKDRYEVAIREGKSASLMQGLGPDGEYRVQLFVKSISDHVMKFFKSVSVTYRPMRQ